MSTYALDSNTMQREIRLRQLKRIERHDDAELNAAVERAARRFEEDFWTLLHGIDAYMERRKRRQARRRSVRELFQDDEHMWGQG